jgi:hypothetical protein
MRPNGEVLNRRVASMGQNIEKPRRRCRGELVLWDTGEHHCLEGRGEKLYLIHMIDDASSELTARFAQHDSTEENMRLLWTYLEQHGRPLAFSTNKAGVSQITSRLGRDIKEVRRYERELLPPTQIGRALHELGIAWTEGHSRQANEPVASTFGTEQDKLRRGIRLTGARTLEEANRYLESQFLPWWNRHLVVAPANPADAHRPLESEDDLAAILSRVLTREVDSDYTVRLDGTLFRIVGDAMPPGLRGATVRLERRLDGSLRVRFGERYWSLAECQAASKPASGAMPKSKSAARRKPPPPSEAYRASMGTFLKRPSMPMWKAAAGFRTHNPDVLD